MWFESDTATNAKRVPKKMLTDQGGRILPLMLVPSAIAINTTILAIEVELLSHEPLCVYFCPVKNASRLGHSKKHNHTRH